MPANGAPLKVGLMVADFPVISETFVINIAAGLLERGHDVRLVAMSGQQPPPVKMHEDVAKFRLSDRVSTPTLGRWLIRPFVRRDRGDIEVWGLSRRIAAFLSQGLMLGRLPKVDIMHCQFATLAVQAKRHRALGLLRARRLVIHVRGHDVTGIPKVHGEDAFREVFGAADLLVANCEHFRKRAISLGAPPDRVIVIGSGIDTQKFKPRDAARKPGGLRLVAVGRLVDKKGFGDAISAMARLPEGLADARLELIGDGPLRDTLSQQISDLGLQDRVTLAGAMSHADIIERLAASDILLAPSVTAKSGDQDAPVNTLKEAMAMEMPVIATYHGGIPELVEDGRNGYLVPEHDPGAIADAIGRLSKESSKWKEMGQYGRKCVIERYDQEIVMNRLIEAYRSILD